MIASPIMIHHMMGLDSSSEAIRALADALRASISSKPATDEGLEFTRLFELLAAKRADGTPGLYIALAYGTARAIEAYGELLKLLPDDKCGELLPALLAVKSANKRKIFKISFLIGQYALVLLRSRRERRPPVPRRG
ncbi:hypothetical protein ACUSIJ_19870 [Pseudochelatococcus sp. B33]